MVQGVVDLAEVFGDRSGGLQVQELVDAVALARAVALADQRPQMPVLDREGDQAARPAGDMPGQGAADRCFAYHAGGQVVAVIVTGGLELPAADEVPADPRGMVAGALRVWAAADVQGKDYWWKAVIPSVRYSRPAGRRAFRDRRPFSSDGTESPAGQASPRACRVRDHAEWIVLRIDRFPDDHAM